MDDETTIRVNKQDALVLKQIQNFLEMQNMGMTQSQLLHEMLQTMLDFHEDFFSEMENHRERHEKLMEEWMKIMLKRTREL